MGLSETSHWLPDPSEVLRLPGRRSLMLCRSDILRYPVLASKVNFARGGIGAGGKSTIVGWH
ncbi:hypothetical protein [Bradyrhizobium zhanjiangense]|uniref:Uncharacterized protein n=1 Tax=Bradyrhizobium zhanjiangense TaxID=1325107 RepID=A0ABY0D8G0_9BRAD|nr:hypothetical protein [Bradyrhizobium zhanjiangense]RXG84922.1 hypothetical protein EAS62_39310 [Bradyrhizobium zhanjiangense]